MSKLYANLNQAAAETDIAYGGGGGGGRRRSSTNTRLYAANNTQSNEDEAMTREEAEAACDIVKHLGTSRGVPGTPDPRAEAGPSLCRAGVETIDKIREREDQINRIINEHVR